MATNDGVPEALSANDGVRPEVDYSVVVEHAAARQLAAARGLMTSHAELGPPIVRLLDEVWATLRAQGVKTGHNVVVYFRGSPVPAATGVFHARAGG